jgi:hypothetical protein
MLRLGGPGLGLTLVLLFAAASAAGWLADPTRSFVDGYDPSENDFFANTAERTVLLRVRDDFDADGVADLALSESSTWGQAGGQWLLFRGQARGGYAYWGTLFFSPAAAALGPDPGLIVAYVRVSAARGGLVTYRLGATGIALEREQRVDLDVPGDRAAYEAALDSGRRLGVEHCRLLDYRRDPDGCWRPGLGR